MDKDTLDDHLLKFKEKFNELRKLLNDHDKLFTEKEPYKIKYCAINILKDMEAELSDIVSDAQNLNEHKVVMLAAVHLNLGLLHADTEELKAGEEQFMKCINLLKGKESESECILLVLSALTQLGIVWSQWNQPLKAKDFLKQAEQIYKDFNDSGDVRREPVSMTECFSVEYNDINLSPRDILEKLHTLTLYYLAQVYGSLVDHYHSAIYCHMTLRRQLELNSGSQEFDHIDWALNAATLSQYFMEHGSFMQARHHLAAASHILSKYEIILQEKSRCNPQSEAFTAEWEVYKHRSADVARCWAKYGILLLSMSKQRLMEDTENDDQSTKSENNIENPEKDTKSDLYNLKFDTLKHDIDVFVNDITDKYLLDYHDARLVFLNIQKWLDEAKAYYTLDSHASDYVQIAQDMSQAYKYLSFFEENDDRRAKMHKRRIGILESVSKELNPQYYKAVCRQIWIELGETYSDILDIKLEALEATNEEPTARALIKINHLAKSAIKNFQMFIDSLETNTRNDEIPKFSDDLVQPALCAYFHLGRLYNKIVTPNKLIQLENTQNTINAYKFIVNYCEKDPNAARLMKMEMNLCKQLLALLPLKVYRLKQELNE